MLIEFSVGNFRSFHAPVTISMEAAAIRSENRQLDESNLIATQDSFKLLTSAVIYGANASGKSNLIGAFDFMRMFVLNSARESQAEDAIPVIPFRLSSDTVHRPTFFEVVFLIDGQKFRYGFEASVDKIEREWLYYTPTIREARLFTREGGRIDANPRSFREGIGLEQRTRPNALFLSVTAQFNGKMAMQIVNWFRNIGIISGLNDLNYRKFTLRQFQSSPGWKEQIERLVRSLDVGIEAIRVEDSPANQAALPKYKTHEIREFMLDDSTQWMSTQTTHTQYDAEGRITGAVEFDLESDESAGTQKLFYLSGPILESLQTGKILIVDELEARMHPLITCAIIRLFHSLETNPRRAQLIFTTHDTNLLDRSIFRRDQIWFVEKDSYGASHLYSLVEFKPRNDESYERNYLRGKYGAIPYLGDIQRMVMESEKKSSEGPDHAA